MLSINTVSQKVQSYQDSIEKNQKILKNTKENIETINARLNQKLVELEKQSKIFNKNKHVLAINKNYIVKQKESIQKNVKIIRTRILENNKLIKSLQKDYDKQKKVFIKIKSLISKISNGQANNKSLEKLIKAKLSNKTIDKTNQCIRAVWDKSRSLTEVLVQVETQVEKLQKEEILITKISEFRSKVKEKVSQYKKLRIEYLKKLEKFSFQFNKFELDFETRDKDGNPVRKEYGFLQEMIEKIDRSLDSLVDLGRRPIGSYPTFDEYLARLNEFESELEDVQLEDTSIEDTVSKFQLLEQLSTYRSQRSPMQKQSLLSTLGKIFSPAFGDRYKEVDETGAVQGNTQLRDSTKKQKLVPNQVYSRLQEYASSEARFHNDVERYEGFLKTADDEGFISSWGYYKLKVKDTSLEQLQSMKACVSKLANPQREISLKDLYEFILLLNDPIRTNAYFKALNRESDRFTSKSKKYGTIKSRMVLPTEERSKRWIELSKELDNYFIIYTQRAMRHTLILKEIIGNVTKDEGISPSEKSKLLFLLNVTLGFISAHVDQINR